MVLAWLFQIVDLPAERGLRQVQPFSGTAEVELISHHNEMPQLPKFQDTPPKDVLK
jgi:hypothetical protein